LAAVLSGPLSQAAPLAVNRRVVVLVPGTEVVCAVPELPAKNAARLAQLAPYALEEQLATEIDAMHFAVGKRGASGKTPVAAVLRERMEQWLAALADAGIQPDVVCAESTVIPDDGPATLIVDAGLVYVRQPSAPGFVLDAQPLDETLQLAIGQVEGDAGTSVLRDVRVYVTQSDYEEQQGVFDGLNESVPGIQVKLLPEGPLPLFAKLAASDVSVNLLSGAYERKSSLAASFAPWRYAAVLLGVAALLHLSYSGVRLWQSVRAERELDKQIRELAMQTLPGIVLNDPRDARKQVEARLGMLKQNDGGGELLGSLSVLREALTQTPGTRIEALFYRTRTIDLRITAPNVDALDKILQAANAAGLSTQIQSATPRDNKVEGRLQLKSGA
jgi:general secretion pathway protein L